MSDIIFLKVKNRLFSKGIKIINVYTCKTKHKSSRVFLLECKLIKLGITFVSYINSNYNIVLPSDMGDVKVRNFANVKRISLDNEKLKEYGFLKKLFELEIDLVIVYYGKMYVLVNNEIFLYSTNEKSKFNPSILSEEERENKEIKRIKADIEKVYTEISTKRSNFFSDFLVIFKNDKGETLNEEDILLTSINQVNDKCDEVTIFDQIYDEKIIENEIINYTDTNEELIIGEVYQIVSLVYIISNKRDENEIQNKIHNDYIKIQSFEKSFFNETLESLYDQIQSYKENIEKYIMTQNEKIIQYNQKIKELVIEKQKLNFLNNKNINIDPLVEVRLNKLITKNKVEILKLKNDIYKKLNDEEIKFEIIKNF